MLSVGEEKDERMRSIMALVILLIFVSGIDAAQSGSALRVVSRGASVAHIAWDKTGDGDGVMIERKVGDTWQVIAGPLVDQTTCFLEGLTPNSTVKLRMGFIRRITIPLRITGKEKAKTIETPLENAHLLILDADNGGDGNANDHAVWCAPHYKIETKKRLLAEMTPVSANVGWGTFSGPKAISVQGESFPSSLWAHAPSRLIYRVPEGVTSFSSQVGIDFTQKGAGSVRFSLSIMQPSGAQLSFKTRPLVRSNSKTTWFVDTRRGNDEQTGRSKTSAWRSLDRLEAVVLSDVDTVVVDGVALAGGGPPKRQDYYLVFCDDFNGTALDERKWTKGWPFKKPKDDRSVYDDQNVIVDNGRLRLRNIPHPQAQSSGGVVTTKNKFATTFGYIEARIKVPAEGGFWPSFWMLKQAGGWPPEIDISEIHTRTKNKVTFNYHNNASGWIAHWGGQFNKGSGCPDFTTDFHNVAVDWQSDYFRWYVDEADRTPYNMNAQQTKQVLEADPVDMYILLTMGCGVSAGRPDSNWKTPVYYEIEWVRVWKRRQE